jgi:poly(3-hydroxybutyrate) depolymerase
MNHGRGSFVFPDPAAGKSGAIRVFYFRPERAEADMPIVIAMHGFDRAASDFRDSLAASAEHLGLLVLVPEFDAETFPGADGYNHGNVRLPPPDEMLIPRDQWNFGIIDRLFKHVRGGRQTFGFFGLSAGGQYVLRYLALTEAPFVGTAIAANCGWYMLPDLASAYPAGMGGVDLGAGDLHRYLERKVVVMLGDADTDANAHDLPRSAAAMAQGPHRLARGLWHFAHCRELAAKLGIRFGWQLEIVAGAVHVDQQVFDLAATMLAAD